MYKWKSGARIHADADVAGKMCEQLEAQGNLTAKALLDANRPEDAPLHDVFEWDDFAAAELYREGQARHIINCLIVTNQQQEPVRAFFQIERSENDYKHIETILKNQDDTEKLLEMASKELDAFDRKFKTILRIIGAEKEFEALRSQVRTSVQQHSRNPSVYAPM